MCYVAGPEWAGTVCNMDHHCHSAELCHCVDLQVECVQWDSNNCFSKHPCSWPSNMVSNLMGSHQAWKTPSTPHKWVGLSVPIHSWSVPLPTQCTKDSVIIHGTWTWSLGRAFLPWPSAMPVSTCCGSGTGCCDLHEPSLPCRWGLDMENIWNMALFFPETYLR